MKLQVLGVGNAFTSRYYNTSFLVTAEHRYLVDCPQALFRLLADRRLDPAGIDRVILTHIHGDHTAGLETLLLWKKYVQQRKVILYTSEQVFEEYSTKCFLNFADTFTPNMSATVTLRIEDYVHFVPLRLDRANRLDSRLALEVRENWHPTPTLGLKFLASEGSIAVSGDTCYRPELLRKLLDAGRLSPIRYEKLAGEWLWQADVIYHEVARHEPSPHTLESDLLALPLEARRKIRLIHYADDFTPGHLPLAEEGEIVTLSATADPDIRPPGPLLGC